MLTGPAQCVSIFACYRVIVHTYTNSFEYILQGQKCAVRFQGYQHLSYTQGVHNTN